MTYFKKWSHKQFVCKLIKQPVGILGRFFELLRSSEFVKSCFLRLEKLIKFERAII